MSPCSYCDTPWAPEALAPHRVLGHLCPLCTIAVELLELASQPLDRVGHVERIEEMVRILSRGAERVTQTRREGA